MAIAQLSSVILVTPRSDLGVFLSRLCQTGCFHPSERSGLVQDTQLVLLSSKAHGVYSEAGALLRARNVDAGSPPLKFTSGSMVDLVSQLAKRSSEIYALLQGPTPLTPEARAGVDAELLAIKDAALAAFRDVSRLRVRPGSRRFLVTEGFVPTSSLSSFRSAMGSYFLASEPIPRRQPGVPYVPSLLVNPRFVGLFEGITLSLGVPKYNEVDPTPVVAFAFPLFFGIMFSDIGRGLILLGAGLFLRNNRREDLRYLGRLIVVLGATSMFVGALRGLFFGALLPYPHLLPSPSFLTQAPSLDVVTFWLEVGIVVGTFHLTVGYVLALTNRLLSKDYGEAFLGYVPTLALYGSTIPFFLALVGAGLSFGSVFTSQEPTPFFTTLLGVHLPVSEVAFVTFPVVLVSLAVLVFGRAVLSLYQTHASRAALRSLMKGVADALIRPAELFVHTVSYIRLGILLVVESIFGELLGGLFGLGVPGILAAIPGNLAVVSIMAFIVYLQDLRLNVYEWFSKFYSGVGRPFSPLVSAGKTFSVTWSLPPTA